MGVMVVTDAQSCKQQASPKRGLPLLLLEQDRGSCAPVFQKVVGAGGWAGRSGGVQIGPRYRGDAGIPGSFSSFQGCRGGRSCRIPEGSRRADPGGAGVGPLGLHQGQGLRTGSVGAGGAGQALQPLSLALGSPAEAGPDRGPEAAYREAPLPRAHAGDHPAHAGQ